MTDDETLAPMGPTERRTLGVVIVASFAVFASMGKPVGTTLWSASAMEGVAAYDGGESWWRLALSFALFVPLALVTARVVRRAPTLVTASLATLPAAALFVMILTVVDAARAIAAGTPMLGRIAMGHLLFAVPWACVVTLPIGALVAAALRWAKRRDEARGAS